MESNLENKENEIKKKMENKEKYKEMNWKDIRVEFNEAKSLRGKFNIINDVVIQKGLLLSLTPLCELHMEISVSENEKNGPVSSLGKGAEDYLQKWAPKERTHNQNEEKDIINSESLTLRLNELFQEAFKRSIKQEVERKRHQDEYKQLMGLLDYEDIESKLSGVRRRLRFKIPLIIGMIIWGCYSLYRFFLHTSELYEWMIFTFLTITLTTVIIIAFITFILDDILFKRALIKEREGKL